MSRRDEPKADFSADEFQSDVNAADQVSLG